MRDQKWDPPEVPEEALSTFGVDGEPATIDDEFAKEDAPKQEYEDE